MNLRDFLNDRLTKADLIKVGDLLTEGLTEKSLPTNLLKQLLGDCGFEMTDARLKRMCEEGRLTRKRNLLRSNRSRRGPAPVPGRNVE
jgi:hypothetical protein